MDPKFIVSLQGREYPLYAGILAEAHERGLKAIEVEIVQIPTQENEHTAIMRATVIMQDGASFSDYGDASPRNVNSKIATALLRMASTRAKGRALRDAVNVGQTMLEELPDQEAAAPPGSAKERANAALLETAARNRERMASLPQTGRPGHENGKAKATAAVQAAETETVADQVSTPAGPGFEAWYEDPKGKRLQRIAMISACRFDIGQAEDLGLTVEAVEPETLANRDLHEFGRALRASLKAQKTAREGGAPGPG
jgi:hypothetical protein